MKVSVLGHPFASIGMGEQLRSCVRALRLLQVDVDVVDIYRFAERSDPAHRDLVQPIESLLPTQPIRIFHINGDEIDPALKALESKGFDLTAGYNVIMPAWELEVYPDVWAEKLKRFDEVWAMSEFVKRSLAASGVQSVKTGQSCEYDRFCCLPRRYFGVRESSYTFLHFFDLSSYRARKNPEAVIAMFRKLLEKRPLDDLQLVLKIKGGEDSRTIAESLIGKHDDRVRIIDETLSTIETLSLINACDCFVSLHRAEGYGRGGAEAMLLGRLAMATAWSGNLDYMTADSSLLVDYALVPVEEGAYPHGEGQVWAEADVEHALYHALRLVDRSVDTLRLARRGREQARSTSGNRSVGVNMLDALTAINFRRGRTE